MPDPTARRRFSRRLRLTHDLEYSRVYAGGARRHAGPLVVFALGSRRDHPRLGLAVSRRVGNAVTRNRIKRRLREAFRLCQSDLPPVDLVVRVRPHEALEVEGYRERLLAAAERLARKLEDRRDDE
jgi:ribonuclease P protein component